MTCLNIESFKFLTLREHGPSWEIDRRLPGQRLFAFAGIQTFIAGFIKNPSLYAVLSQFSPFYAIIPYLVKMHFSIVFSKPTDRSNLNIPSSFRTCISYTLE